MLKDFKQFILRGNTVDLAVAVVIGSAFNGVVQALVKDMITPLVNPLTNGQFSNAVIHIHSIKLSYGDFLNTLVSFILIAAVVYFLVVRPINKLVSFTNRNKTTDNPTTKKCPECLSEIPIKATRCAFCTTNLKD